jgi:hypothetical protein
MNRKRPKCALHTCSRATTGGLPQALRLRFDRSGGFPCGHRMAPSVGVRARSLSRCPSHGSCAAFLQYISNREVKQNSPLGLPLRGRPGRFFTNQGTFSLLGPGAHRITGRRPRTAQE